jgi:hypothetical protein
MVLVVTGCLVPLLRSLPNPADAKSIITYRENASALKHAAPSIVGFLILCAFSSDPDRSRSIPFHPVFWAYRCTSNQRSLRPVEISRTKFSRGDLHLHTFEIAIRVHVPLSIVIPVQDTVPGNKPKPDAESRLLFCSADEVQSNRICTFGSMLRPFSLLPGLFQAEARQL